MTDTDRLREAAQLLEITTRTPIENPGTDRAERDATAALLRAVADELDYGLTWNAALALADAVLGDK